MFFSRYWWYILRLLLLILFSKWIALLLGIKQQYVFPCRQLYWWTYVEGQLGLGHTNEVSSPQRVSYFDEQSIDIHQFAQGSAHSVVLTCMYQSSDIHLITVGRWRKSVHMGPESVRTVRLGYRGFISSLTHGSDTSSQFGHCRSREWCLPYICAHV